MSVFVEQTEVDAPCVDTDGGDVLILAECALAQSAFYLMENAENIPCELTVCHHGFIGETVNLLERDFVAVKAADYSSAV